ncbi:MAG TPA: protein translocase subunit SecF [Candidatus Humimicrobiaceae bacterium]|nr:protein translocase subunit SecF [Candidatus Humimicrobiaceae bacterium]
MKTPFLKYRKIYFILSGILVLGSLTCLGVFGLKPGIDFTGGSILEIKYEGERPAIEAVRQVLNDVVGPVFVQPTDSNGLLIRMQEIDEGTHQQVLGILKESYQVEELRFESIGPVVGRELREKTTIVVILSLLAIVLYIAFSFRKIQRPISSWQYGLTSLLALFHDVLIPIGILAILGEFYGVQITISVIIALLMVLGYSINNTVVVFDRIRENLLKRVDSTFTETVDKSLNQTLARCLNTSLTTLFVLIAIFFLGGETLKYFALVLILGIIAGTYSSFFLVSPILVAWLEWRRK